MLKFDTVKGHFSSEINSIKQLIILLINIRIVKMTTKYTQQITDIQLLLIQVEKPCFVGFRLKLPNYLCLFHFG